MKIKMILGFCLLFVLVAWNVNAQTTSFAGNPKLEIALREALAADGNANGPFGGVGGATWLPPIPEGSIDTAELATLDVDLDISNLGLTKLDGLEAATALTGLDASGNSITSLTYGSGASAVSVLDGLGSAIFVDLSNNKLASTSLAYSPGVSPGVPTSVLESLVLCENLNLSNNLITLLSYGTTTKASVFEDLAVLEVLNLNNNMIALPTEISYIGVCTTLKELYLSNNKIAGMLPNICSLVLLEKLQLNGNLITDFSKLDPTVFTALEYLDISSNSGPFISVRRINPALGGDTITVQINIASVTNLYGISFKLHFESDANVTASNGDVTDSVLGTTLTSNFNYPSATPGDVGISISKQSGTGGSASGKLATVDLALDATATYVTLTFDDVNALTSTGASITITVPPLASYVVAGPSANNVTVFPGDTDNSGTVDASDLTGIADCWGYQGTLALGVYNTARPIDIKTPASNIYRTTWFPQVAPKGTDLLPLWLDGITPVISTSDPTNTEAAQADCNGDGIVDEKDVLVIALNWNKVDTVYTAPLAPSRQSGTGYSLPVLNELLDGVKSMPKSEAREKMITVLKDAIAQTQRAFVPKENIVLQNYPNPFNPETWLPFQLVKDADVSVRIFDTNGKMVRSLELGRKTAGSYLTKELAAYWDGKTMTGEQVSSGVYFYNIQAGNYSATRKMMVLK